MHVNNGKSSDLLAGPIDVGMGVPVTFDLSLQHNPSLLVQRLMACLLVKGGAAPPTQEVDGAIVLGCGGKALMSL